MINQNKNSDLVSFYNAIYVLSGICGQLPSKPFFSNLEVEDISEEEKAKRIFERNKERFENIKTIINKN